MREPVVYAEGTSDAYTTINGWKCCRNGCSDGCTEHSQRYVEDRWVMSAYERMGVTDIRPRVQCIVRRAADVFPLFD